MNKVHLISQGLAVLMLMMFIPTVTQSQSKFGIRAGLNVTNVSLESLPDKKENFGFHVGIFAELPVVTDFLSLQPELSFTTKGANYEILNDEQELNLNYIEFLLPVAFHLGSIDVQVGPAVSYLVSSRDFTVYNDNTVIEDAFNTVDAGLTAGLSYNFNNMFVGIRYTQGMVNITTEDAEPFLGEGKNAAGQVSLGFKF